MRGEADKATVRRQRGDIVPYVLIAGAVVLAWQIAIQPLILAGSGRGCDPPGARLPRGVAARSRVRTGSRSGRERRSPRQGGPPAVPLRGSGASRRRADGSPFRARGSGRSDPDPRRELESSGTTPLTPGWSNAVFGAATIRQPSPTPTRSSGAGRTSSRRFSDCLRPRASATRSDPFPYSPACWPPVRRGEAPI